MAVGDYALRPTNLRPVELSATTLTANQFAQAQSAFTYRGENYLLTFDHAVDARHTAPASLGRQLLRGDGDFLTRAFQVGKQLNDSEGYVVLDTPEHGRYAREIIQTVERAARARMPRLTAGPISIRRTDFLFPTAPGAQRIAKSRYAGRSGSRDVSPDRVFIAPYYADPNPADIGAIYGAVQAHVAAAPSSSPHLNINAEFLDRHPSFLAAHGLPPAKAGPIRRR